MKYIFILLLCSCSSVKYTTNELDYSIKEDINQTLIETFGTCDSIYLIK